MQVVSDVQEMNKNMADFGIIPADQLLLDDNDNDSETTKDDKDVSFSDQSISMLDYDGKVDEK